MYVREQPELKEKKLTFAVSGKLWNRSLVMVDSGTESLWSHLLGKAMDGELKGTILETLPSTMADWKSWKIDHPETTVLALKRTSREFVKEFHEDVDRFVLGLRTPLVAKSYGFGVLKEKRVINDEFDGEPVIVVFRPESAGGRAYSRKLEGKTLQFESTNEGKSLQDVGSKSMWNPESGICESGALEGSRLDEIPAIVSFKRAWDVFYPESKPYNE
ncbi:MAG: hypothetical protein ACI8UO_002644 [Verrucomicrobiales bacterium]